MSERSWAHDHTTQAAAPGDASPSVPYGERLAARHLVEQGLVVLDRNWRCDAGEIDLVLRDGAVLVVCEVKTRTSDACGTPARGGHPRQARHASDAWPPLVDRARRASREVRLDLVAVHSAAPRRLAGRPCPGDRLMAFATAHTVSLHGALGHLIDVQADVSPGLAGTTLVGRPDAVPPRGPRPVPDGRHQLRRAVAGPPGG